MGLHDCKSTKL